MTFELYFSVRCAARCEEVRQPWLTHSSGSWNPRHKSLCGSREAREKINRWTSCMLHLHPFTSLTTNKQNIHFTYWSIIIVEPTTMPEVRIESVESNSIKWIHFIPNKWSACERNERTSYCVVSLCCTLNVLKMDDTDVEISLFPLLSDTQWRLKKLTTSRSSRL